MAFKKRKNFLVFGSPNIEKDEINAVVRVLKSGWIGTGPLVKKFEENFAIYKNTKYSQAVSSCTAALHLSLSSLDLKLGDEVITTAMTFCSTVNSIIHAGAKPVIVDIDPLTLNIDPTEIEKKITNKTKAIIPVHFAGNPCEMNEIKFLSKKYNLSIIEDCAHAIETEYKGEKAGSIGSFGCFSFYVTKNLVTAEGGMVISKSKNAYNKIKSLSLHGMSHDAWKRFGKGGYKHYKVIEPGFKYNMTDLQAAMGVHQLEKIEKNWEKRKLIWYQYKDELKNLPVILPPDEEKDCKHSYHLFTIQIDEKITGLSREKFLNEMKIRNIGVGVHYQSIPEHPIYRKLFKWKASNFPHSYDFGKKTVSLPISPILKKEDVNDVVSSVYDILKKFKT